MVPIDIYFTHIMSLLTVKDVLEILFFTTILYRFSLWLKKDLQKNLVPYLYAYSSAMALAYYLPLPTISSFLLVGAPVALIFLVVIHQEILQKNFVALKNYVPAKVASTDWLETLIRSSLIAINNNQSIRCIIESTDNMQQFLNTPLVLHADIKQELLDIIFSSPSYTQNTLIWLNANGIIKGINAHWQMEYDDDWLAHDMHNLEKWKQDALFFSHKTDALIFNITPESRTFELIAGGKIFNNVSAPHVMYMIKKHLDGEKKGDIHDNINATQKSEKEHNA